MTAHPAALLRVPATDARHRAHRRLQVTATWIVLTVATPVALGWLLAAPRSPENVIPAASLGAGESERSRASSAPLVTLVVPSETMPASPASDGVGVRLDDGTEPETPARASVVPGGTLAPATTAGVSGTASWFCKPPTSKCTKGYPASCQCAAAGPALRVGNWRRSFVYVAAGARSIRVQLVDVCQCFGSRVIDLYAGSFAFLAPLSQGLVKVTVDRGPSNP